LGLSYIGCRRYDNTMQMPSPFTLLPFGRGRLHLRILVAHPKTFATLVNVSA